MLRKDIKITAKLAKDRATDAVPLTIDTPFITLDSALKFSGEAETGGHAKELILDGEVKVNGSKINVIRKKLYDGDIFEVNGVVYKICKG